MTTADAVCDLEIRRLIRQGHPEGMDRLVARHGRRVRGILIRMVGPEVATDLTQEVFLRAYTNLDGFRGEASLGWWISRIAINCARRHIKRDRTLPVDIQSVDLPDRGHGPEDRALLAEDRLQVRRALQRLPESDREILLLREVLGLPYEDIRDRMALKRVGTVKSRLHKARTLLRRLFHRPPPPVGPNPALPPAGGDEA